MLGPTPKDSGTVGLGTYLGRYDVESFLGSPMSS